MSRSLRKPASLGGRSQPGAADPEENVHLYRFELAVAAVVRGEPKPAELDRSSPESQAR